MATFVPYKNYFYNQLHGMSSLVVATVGKEQSSPGFVHRPDVRAFYTLHFCIRGKGTLRTSNKTHTVVPGDLMLIYPNVKIYPKADRQDPWSSAGSALPAVMHGCSPMPSASPRLPRWWGRSARAGRKSSNSLEKSTRAVGTAQPRLWR